MQPQAEQPQPATRAGSIRGRYVVFATLSLFIIVPAISIFIAPMLSNKAGPIDLDYAQRDQWFAMPVKPRPLKYNTFVAAETGKQYKRTDLTIDPVVETALQQMVALAKSDGFFESDQARDELLTFAADEQYGFYPAYLLASWYQVNGQADAFGQWVQVAFKRAGGGLMQTLVDDKRAPVAGYRLPPVAIGYDRVIEGQLDATLVLVYPAPTSDPAGNVYLPTFRSVYRLTDPYAPIGSDPGLHPRGLTLLPQRFDGTEPNWFAVPDGAVGRFEDAAVSPK